MALLSPVSLICLTICLLQVITYVTSQTTGQTGRRDVSDGPRSWNSLLGGFGSFSNRRSRMRQRRIQRLMNRGWIPPPDVQNNLLRATSPSSSPPSSSSGTPNDQMIPSGSFMNRFDFGFSPDQLLSSDSTGSQRRVPGEWNSMSQMFPFQTSWGFGRGTVNQIGGMPWLSGSRGPMGRRPGFFPPNGPGMFPRPDRFGNRNLSEFPNPTSIPGGGLPLGPSDVIGGTGASVSEITSLGVNEATHDHASDTPHVHEAEGIIHAHPHDRAHTHDPMDPNFMPISGGAHDHGHIDMNPTHPIDLTADFVDPTLPLQPIVEPSKGYNAKGSVDILADPGIPLPSKGYDDHAVPAAVDPLHDHGPIPVLNPVEKSASMMLPGHDHDHVNSLKKDYVAPVNKVKVAPVLPNVVDVHDHVDVLSPDYVPPVNKVKVAPVLPNVVDVHDHVDVLRPGYVPPVNKVKVAPVLPGVINAGHDHDHDHVHDHGSVATSTNIKHVGSVVVPTKKTLPASYVSPTKGMDLSDHKAAILAIEKAIAENEALSIRMEQDIKKFKLEGNPHYIQLGEALAENRIIRVQLEKELKEMKHKLEEHLAHVHKEKVVPPPPAPKSKPKPRKKKNGLLKGLILGGLGALLLGK